jgi:phosphoribosylformylglycinamidine synthase
MWLARVYVSLKPTVNDPQGLAIRGGLHHLGFDTVDSVRMGKYLEVRLTDAEEAEARRKVDDMCRKLLANPVVERYSFDLEAEG